MQKQPQDNHIFAKQDTIVSKESIFVKGNTIMDKNDGFFPDDLDSDDSDSMIGGLGNIKKDPSSIMTNQGGKSNIFDDSEDETSRGGSFTIEREEKKYSTSESNDEDAEIVKGDDFTDSDEDDLTIRFSK